MENKKVLNGLLFCIILYIIGLIGYLLLDIISNKIVEPFFGKRDVKMKIYKSEEINDPDELPEYNDDDPDTIPMLFDPDQQTSLNNLSIHNKINNRY